MIDLEQMIRDIVRQELGKQQPANDDTGHITVEEYARRRSISQSTVRAAIRENRLPCLRVGRAVRVPSSAEIAAPVKNVVSRARAKLLGGR